jgi:hypothetical protein
MTISAESLTWTSIAADCPIRQAGEQRKGKARDAKRLSRRI